MRALIQEYRASLKSVEVEEPIDLLVHRPPAFLIAKFALRTPLTPNQLTLLSVASGVLGGLALFSSSPAGPYVAGGLLVLSQVIDCSDGMLARMRKSSSVIGRMFDGVADMFSILAAVAGSIHVMSMRYPSPPWVPVAITALTVLTVYTSSFHTSAYDHYKNVFLRMTKPGAGEGEDVDAVQARQDEAARAGMPLAHALVYQIYLGYLKGQRRLLAWFDPYTVARFDALPAFDERNAAIYRHHAAGLMNLWRGLFGVGSLVFGLAVASALRLPELFLVYRLVVLNGLFFFVLWPAQRRASRQAFREMGLAVGLEADAVRRPAH